MHTCYEHAHVLQTCVQAHALMRIHVPMQACSMGMHMQLHTQAWLGRPHLHVRMYTYLRPHLHVCMEVVKCAHALHHSEMCTWITQCNMQACRHGNATHIIDCRHPRTYACMQPQGHECLACMPRLFAQGWQSPLHTLTYKEAPCVCTTACFTELLIRSAWLHVAAIVERMGMSN